MPESGQRCCVEDIKIRDWLQQGFVHGCSKIAIQSKRTLRYTNQSLQRNPRRRR